MEDLPQIILAAILVDTVTVAILYMFNRGGKAVKEWYKEFRMGAACMDVFSIIIATAAANALGKTLAEKIGYLLAIQVVHDLAIGWLVKSVESKSTLLNMWKRYADEVGFTIVIVDAVMLLATLFLVHYMKKIELSDSAVIYASIVVFYVLLMFVYSY